MSRVYLGTHDFTGATLLGGGASPSPFDATVGTGGDYADIQAAITGVGGTDISLLMISDVTEDSNIAVPSGGNLLIHLQTHTLTMGANQFTYSGAANVYIRGNGPDSGAEIDYTQTVISENLFDNVAFTSSVVDAQGFLFDNNSNTGGVNFFSGAIQKLRDVKADLINQPSKGFELRENGSYATNIEIVGGGTLCHSCLVLGTSGSGKSVSATQLLFSGTFHPSVGALICYDKTSCTGVVTNHSTWRIVTGKQTRVA